MGKDKEIKENKPANTRVKMTIGILFLVVLSVVELYLMINESDQYLFLGIVGMAILCFVYWIMDLSFKMHRVQDSIWEKEFENLYKAQKVSYVTVKQGFVKLEELLDEMEEELSFPLEEVLQAQKAVGRVTIQKNKENIDAVVESNAKLIDRLQLFEQKFEEISGRIQAFQDAVAAPLPDTSNLWQEEMSDSLLRIEAMLKDKAENTAMLDRQQEILGSLAELGDVMRRELNREPADRQQEVLDYLARIESSVKDELSELEEHMGSKIDEIPSAVQEEQKMSAEELDLILGKTDALMETMKLDLPEDEMNPELSEPASQTAGQNMAGGAAEEKSTEEESYEIPEHLLNPDLTGQTAGQNMTGGATEAESIEEESYEIPKHLLNPDLTGQTAGQNMAGGATEAESIEEESYEIPEHLLNPDLTGQTAGQNMAGGAIEEESTNEESYEIPEHLLNSQLAEETAGQNMTDGLSEEESINEESYEIPEHLLNPELTGLSAEQNMADGLTEEGSYEEESYEIPDLLPIEEPVNESFESEGIPGSEKVMTPEEIASLLGDSVEPEEQQEDAKDEFPMPDLSDPGHVMTPEEIAALLANM